MRQNGSMATDRSDFPSPMARSTGVWPAVSVIMPVLNEELDLAASVGSILRQDYPGEIEIVLAVGPSRDLTHTIASRLAATEPSVRVIANPSGRTPDGLNAAIAVSSHPVIARMDGHSVLQTDYLRVAVKTLQETGAANVGAVVVPEGVTPFQQAVARAQRSKLGVGNAPFRTGGAGGPAETAFLGVFRRDVLERIGGYDPAFTRAQDWEMNHRIRESGGLVWLEPDLRVRYVPRSSLIGLCRQYFGYGRWRRVAARHHRGTLRLRYILPPLNLLLLFTAIALAIAGYPLALLVPGAYLLAVITGSVWTGIGLPPRSHLWLPLVYIVMHLAWGFGFLTSPRSLGPQAK